MILCFVTLLCCTVSYHIVLHYITLIYFLCYVTLYYIVLLICMVNIADSTSYNLAGVKLAMSIKGGSSVKDNSVISADKSPYEGRAMLVPKQKSIHMPKSIVPQRTLELQLQPGVCVLFVSILAKRHLAEILF